MQLRIPGPTPLPKIVRQALSQQVFGHRSKQFAKMFKEITNSLKEVFQTKNDLFIFPASGTGAMEASIVNFFSPSDKVMVLSCGIFGERFIEIAQCFGLTVKSLYFPYGQAIDWQIVKKTVKREKGLKGVIVTHNETSTGITNNLEPLREIVGEKVLTIVDGVSSLAAIDLPVDKLDIDVAISASQKAWMAPPGLCLLSVSRSAWQAHQQACLPRYYFDIGAAKRFYEKGGFTPYTPAVTTLLGLGQAIKLINQEGLTNVFMRHQEIGNLCRQNLKKMGLKLFADPRYASDTVTAVLTPLGVNVSWLLKELRQNFGVFLASGQGPLKGKIFRIAHMGWVSKKDIKEVVQAIGEVLNGA